MRFGLSVPAALIWAVSMLVAPAVQAQTAAPAASQPAAKPAMKPDAKPADATAKPDAKAETTRTRKGATASDKPAAILDINSATAEELDTLPGIGKVRAARIIKGRPYKGKDELVDKKVLPKSVYEKLKDRIIAKQS